VTIDGTQVVVSVTVSGEPGAQVRLWIEDDSRVHTATMDGSGEATISFRPTLRQILRGADFYIAYATDDAVGEPLTLRLSL